MLMQPWDQKIQAEVQMNGNNYAPSLQRCSSILAEIEQITKRSAVSYQASLVKRNNEIDQIFDERKLEQLIDSLPKNQGLDLILTSPGGQALGAERIINLFLTKKEKFNNSFRVIVPKIAKSAATMIALGADQIVLFETAELGPVDPQFTLKSKDQNGEMVKVIPAHRVLEGVDTIIERTKKLNCFDRNTWNILMQQQNYDLYLWAKNEIDLSKKIIEDIARRKAAISPHTKISFEDYKIFLDPKYTLTHGRPITLRSLGSNDIFIREKIIINNSTDFGIDLNGENTKKVSELLIEYYFRTSAFLNDIGNGSSKILETASYHFRELDPLLTKQLQQIAAQPHQGALSA